MPRLTRLMHSDLDFFGVRVEQDVLGLKEERSMWNVGNTEVEGRKENAIGGFGVDRISITLSI